MENNNANAFSVFLRGASEALKLSQYDIARIAQVAQPSVNGYFTGDRYPSKRTMLLLMEGVFMRLLTLEGQEEERLLAQADLMRELKGSGATEIRTAIASLKNSRLAIAMTEQKGRRNE